MKTSLSLVIDTIDQLKALEQHTSVRISYDQLYALFEYFMRDPNLPDIKYFVEESLFADKLKKSNEYFRYSRLTVLTRAFKAGCEMAKYLLQADFVKNEPLILDEQVMLLSTISESLEKVKLFETIYPVQAEPSFWSKSTQYSAKILGRNEEVYSHLIPTLPQKPLASELLRIFQAHSSDGKRLYKEQRFICEKFIDQVLSDEEQSVSRTKAFNECFAKYLNANDPTAEICKAASHQLSVPLEYLEQLAGKPANAKRTLPKAPTTASRRI